MTARFRSSRSNGESPELNMVVSSRFADPRTGVVDYRLTNINRSEPRADLFHRPGGLHHRRRRRRLPRCRRRRWSGGDSGGRDNGADEGTDYRTLSGSTSTVTRRRISGISASAARSAWRISARRVPFRKNCTRCSPRSRASGAGAGPSTTKSAGPRPPSRAPRRQLAGRRASPPRTSRPRTTALTIATIGG